MMIHSNCEILGQLVLCEIMKEVISKAYKEDTVEKISNMLQIGQWIAQEREYVQEIQTVMPEYEQLLRDFPPQYDLIQTELIRRVALKIMFRYNIVEWSNSFNLLSIDQE